MTIFHSGGSKLGISDPTTTSTTAVFALGSVQQFYDTVIGDTGEYIYVQFGATVTVGQVCTIDNTLKAALASSTTHANKGWAVGFAIGSAADTEYGWLKVSGKVKAKAATVAASTQMFLTTTAGTIDDAAIAGSQVLGAKIVTADGTPAAGFCYAQINRPHVQGQIT
jgi:hypothetical protein